MRALCPAITIEHNHNHNNSKAASNTSQSWCLLVNGGHCFESEVVSFFFARYRRGYSPPGSKVSLRSLSASLRRRPEGGCSPPRRRPEIVRHRGRGRMTWRRPVDPQLAEACLELGGVWLAELTHTLPVFVAVRVAPGNLPCRKPTGGQVGVDQGPGDGTAAAVRSEGRPCAARGFPSSGRT